MWLRNKVRAWLGVDALEQENAALRDTINRQAGRITNRIAELDKLTKVDADIGVRGPCTVILSGVYRGRGYVRFYEMSHDEFRYVVDEYNERRRHGSLRNIDAIPGYRGGAFSIR